MFLQRLKELHIGKRKSVRLLAGIFLLASGFCIFQLLLPKDVLHFQGSHVFEQGVATEETVVYDNISLKPGVYFVELEYQAEKDFLAHCNMKDGTVFTGGLRTNGDQTYGGLDRTGFCIWLYEGTDSMQTVVSYNGEGGFATGDLTITDTGRLWTMLLVLFFLAAGAVLGGIVFYDYNKRYPVDASKKQVFFFLTLISFSASLPYLFGGTFSGGDMVYHAHRIVGVKDGLLGGQFPVRLEPEWAFGHGYAAGVFYCNALLYLPGLLMLAGFPVVTAFHCYVVAVNIATAWIAWYCFRHIFQEDGIGLVCSALHTLSFYRISNTVGSGALGESSALIFLPLILYGMYRVFVEDREAPRYRTSWVPLALGYAGVVQTHVLSCEITAVLTLVVCILCFPRILCGKTFLELAKGALAALGLSLWFLVPFLDYFLTQDVHVRHVSARRIQLCGLQMGHLFFQFWQSGDNERIQYPHSLPLGFLLVLGLAVFAALWFGGFLKGRGDGRTPFVKVVFCFGAALLAMSLGIFPWDKVQGLNSLSESLVGSLEMPSRFLAWGTTCAIAVFGFCLYFLKGKGGWGYPLGMAAAVAGIAAASLFYMDSLDTADRFVRIYNEQGMGMGYLSGNEYLPEGTDSSLLTYKDAVPGEGVRVDSYQKEYLHVDMSCTNTGGAESYVELPMLAYRGYQAVVEGGGKLTVCPGENHVVRVLLPAHFSGKVEVKFVSPFYWRLSELASLLTLLSLLAWAVVRRRKRA